MSVVLLKIEGLESDKPILVVNTPAIQFAGSPTKQEQHAIFRDLGIYIDQYQW